MSHFSFPADEPARFCFADLLSAKSALRFLFRQGQAPTEANCYPKRQHKFEALQVMEKPPKRRVLGWRLFFVEAPCPVFVKNQKEPAEKVLFVVEFEVLECFCKEGNKKTTSHKMVATEAPYQK